MNTSVFNTDVYALENYFSSILHVKNCMLFLNAWEKCTMIYRLFVLITVWS